MACTGGYGIEGKLGNHIILPNNFVIFFFFLPTSASGKAFLNSPRRTASCFRSFSLWNSFSISCKSCCTLSLSAEKFSYSGNNPSSARQINGRSTFKVGQTYSGFCPEDSSWKGINDKHHYESEGAKGRFAGSNFLCKRRIAGEISRYC